MRKKNCQTILHALITKYIFFVVREIRITTVMASIFHSLTDSEVGHTGT